jgi:TRAP-type C4-dicarboxylate transport system permease small subunit
LAELLLSDTGPRHRGFGLVLDSLCKLFAIGAGLSLITMALLSLWSIVGRTFFDSALLGDFELVQAFCALAVSMGLPYAQWVNGNVIVDFFTAKAPAKLNAVLDAIARLIMAFFSGLLAWRLYVGLIDLGRFSPIYDLSVVPLFLLMGQFATHGGLSRRLFQAGNAFIGHWRGGMAMAASAPAPASARSAAPRSPPRPPWARWPCRNCAQQLLAALVDRPLAAGGTLGILIPPSVPLVIYAILAEQNIAKLFIAALIPGMIAMIGYMVVMASWCRSVPGRAGPRRRCRGRAPRACRHLAGDADVRGRDRRHLRRGVHPTEAAAIGAIATGIAGDHLGRMQGQVFLECRARRRRGDRDDLPDPARRRRAQRLPGAVPQMPAALAAWVLGSGCRRCWC